jgi:hypothetical protein
VHLKAAREDPPASPAAAGALARETSQRITNHPELAARAQANVNSAGVLSMLQ